MYKLVIMLGDIVLMEQHDNLSKLATFFPSPNKVMRTVHKQKWFALVDCTGEEPMCYKVVPVENETVLDKNNK